MFDRFKERRRENQEQRKLQQAQSRYNSALVQWEDESEHVENLLHAATHLDELYRLAAESGFTVRLKNGEHVLLGLGGSGLIEPRSGGGSYQGGSRGVSFRVAKGVRYRMGQHKGTFVANPEVLKVFDTDGNLYITTDRVLYTSPGRNREWAFPKLVDIYHSDSVSGSTDWGATFIAVANRQKTSGFIYPMSHAGTVRDRLLLAMAVHDGTIEDLITGLKQQQVELQRSRPTPPPPQLEG